MNYFQKIDDKLEWQKLLDKALFKTFFHSLKWESFLEKNFSWLKFEHYLYKDEALLSVAKYKILGKERFVSHPFCEYGGPLPLVGKIDFQRFKEDLFKQFKRPLKISFHPKLLNYFENIPRTTLERAGTPRETFFFEDLDKKDITEIFGCLDRNRRRAIKRASDKKFEIRECQTEKELHQLYQFYLKNLKKHRTLVYPFSFFKFFFKNPNSKILLAKIARKNIGGNIFIFYDNLCHSFLCGFDEKYKNFGVHSLVIWEMIKESQNKGLAIFDFGATKKDSPLRSFKQRWGAQCYPIFELKNYSEDSKLKDSFLRKVWSYLPTGLIKILSPYFIKYKL